MIRPDCVLIRDLIGFLSGRVWSVKDWNPTEQY